MPLVGGGVGFVSIMAGVETEGESEDISMMGMPGTAREDSSGAKSSSQQLFSFMRCVSKTTPALRASRTCFDVNSNSNNKGFE